MKFVLAKKKAKFVSAYHWVLCILGAGKKAFIQADGIKTLYTLSLETLECKEQLLMASFYLLVFVWLTQSV